MKSLLAIGLASAISFLSACSHSQSVNQPIRTEGARSEISNNENQAVESADVVKININTASFEELQRIPHIGPSVAQRVIAHRERHGPFKRPEELMMVQGMGDMRFRRIRHLIRVE